MTAAPKDDTSRSGAEAGWIWLITTIVMVPVVKGRILWTDPGGAGDPNRQWAFTAFDIPLVILTGVVALHAFRHGSTRPSIRGRPVLIAFAALIAWSFISTAVHPSWRAADWLLHVAGGAAACWVLLQVNAQRLRFTLWVLVGLGVLQGLLGMAQSFRGEPLGLGALEYSLHLYEFGTRPAATGSFAHPYHLATLLMVAVGATYVLWSGASAVERRLSCGALALLGSSLPFTFSRSAWVGLIPLIVIGFASRRPRLRAPTFFLVAALAAGTIINLGGWSAKAEKSLDRERIDSGRIDLAEEAFSLMLEEPVVGIGTGRYAVEVSERKDAGAHPPHNAILQAGAELGVPGFVLTAAFLGGVGWLAITGGALSTIVYLTVVPFHLLDAYPHVFPRGLLMSGLWVGMIVVARRDGRTAISGRAFDDARLVRSDG